MPTRTELVISIGNVLECLPPGITFKRRRYNSFDANVGNEENLAPGSVGVPCKLASMKQTDKIDQEPEVLTVRSKKAPANDEDAEISFRQDILNPDEGIQKSKRKTSAEKFLEDNANYFQLEVLDTKTRSNKLLDVDNPPVDEDDESGFHGSFLDFLKSKDVCQKESGGRSRHKSAGSEMSHSSRHRSPSSSRHGRSRSSGRSLNGRVRSKSRGYLEVVDIVASKKNGKVSSTSNRDAKSDTIKSVISKSELDVPIKKSRSKQGSPSESIANENKNNDKVKNEENGEQSGVESETESSVRTRRSKLSSVSGSDLSPVTTIPNKDTKRDASLSGSEVDIPVRSMRTRHGLSLREVSLSESETDSVASSLVNNDMSPVINHKKNISGKSDNSPKGSVKTRHKKKDSPKGVSSNEPDSSIKTFGQRSKRTDTGTSSNFIKEQKNKLISGSKSKVNNTSKKVVKRAPSPSDSEVDKLTPNTIEQSASESDLSPVSAINNTSVKISSSKIVKCEPSPSSSEVEVPSRPRRSRQVLSMREISISESEPESVASSVPQSKIIIKGLEVVDSETPDDDDSDDEKDKDGNSTPRKGRRSELDKLLEAVDNSFHFETAAAERKRLSDNTNMKPLEIDCSDTGSEASCNVSNKRKFSESEKDSEENIKKSKGSNNLLKTASPSTGVRKDVTSEDDSVLDGSSSWDGWEALSSHLSTITHSPVPVDGLHFSFECEPSREGWYTTYQRQDIGEEVLFYPSSTSAPFKLPYEMNYSSFFPGNARREAGKADISRPESKASSPSRQTPTPANRIKGGKRKASECESTDSEDHRKGRGGKGGKPAVKLVGGVSDKLGTKINHLFEPNHRISPRCHASSKATNEVGLGDLDDLAEAYIMQDERELHFPNLMPFLNVEENSNDSLSSAVSSKVKTESLSDVAQLATNLDTFLQKEANIATGEPAKVPPTRSRVSSDQLLSPKKPKKKKNEISPLDQVVADDIDPVLLDCLEDELPTVPLDSTSLGLMELLATYSSCTSMSTCNSRWLRPSKRQHVVDQQPPVANIDTKSTPLTPKKVPSPSKPKRIIIYKDDLPGFSIDGDMETEKLPVSRRGLAKAKSDYIPVAVKPPDDSNMDIKPPVKNEDEVKKEENEEVKKDENKEVKEEDENKEDSELNKVKEPSDDEDSISVESFNSTSSSSKKRRKVNKTGFPSPKKKKKSLSPSVSPSKSSDGNKSKSSSPVNIKSNKKIDIVESSSNTSNVKEEKNTKKVTKQVKMDLFITKKTVKTSNTAPKSSSSSPQTGSRRTAALKAKNYSELESDTESLLESPLLPSSQSRAPSLQKSGKAGKKK